MPVVHVTYMRLYISNFCCKLFSFQVQQAWSGHDYS